MPFPKQDPKPFTRQQVLAVTPGQMGCYGLFKRDQWIYVGKGDIRARLLDHLNGDKPRILVHKPTHWVDVVTQVYDEREKRLIEELEPVCNQRVG